MALTITDVCIRCHICIPQCPSNAIYKAGENWSMSQGTKHTDNSSHKPLSGSITFIVPEKCIECVDVYDEPRCSEVCPVSASVKLPENIETLEQLKQKKQMLLG